MNDTQATVGMFFAALAWLLSAWILTISRARWGQELLLLACFFTVIAFTSFASMLHQPKALEQALAAGTMFFVASWFCYFVGKKRQKRLRP